MSQHLNKRHTLGWMLFAVLCVAGTVWVAAVIDRPREISIDLAVGAKGAATASGFSMDRIEQDIRVFTSCASRLSGREGAERAFAHIRDALGRAGVTDITVQEFPVLVPQGSAASLTVGSGASAIVVPLHPLWPNLARTGITSPQGLAGHLIDAGGGTEAEMQGKQLSGAVVLMDWDCDLEWLSVPEFGGRAIVFRGNRPADGNVARRKFLSVPADIPRYYVASEDVPALARAFAPDVSATIVCDSQWQQVTARNLLARVCPATGGPATGNASDPDQSPVVFHAYYDSISVVPDLAPGAEQSCGAAALLELARYFAAHPASRPVQVLFTGGHGQALAGMTHYVRGLQQPDAAKPGLMVGLDLSSHADAIGVFCLGHFREQPELLIRHKFSLLGATLAMFAGKPNPAAESGPAVDKSFVDGINLSGDRGWWSFFPYRTAFESELPTLAGIPGITLASVNDSRRFVDTPDDTVERLAFDGLARQLEARPDQYIGLLGLARVVAQWKGPFVSSRLENNLARIQGRAVWLDQRRNYTPNEPLIGATVFLKKGKGDRDLLGTRGLQGVATDAQGLYTLDGLMQSPIVCTMEIYGTASPDFLDRNPDAVRQYQQVVAQAAVAAEATTPGGLSADGSIIYAVDMARGEDYAWTVQAARAEQHATVVCFPCRTFSLLGLTDPRGYIPLTDVNVLNAATASPPFQFGRSLTDAQLGDQSESLATLWTDPSLHILVTLGVGFQGKRLVLVNNSLDKPEGAGFVMADLTTLPSMVLQGTQDMWNLTETRMRKLAINGVNTPRVQALHEEATASLAAADAALAAYDYRDYRIAAERAWALESKAYGGTLDMINNMIHGVLFYLALLLPLSYCLERLLVASESIKKRMSWILAIFSASFALLAAVHPAFRFTMTPLLVLLAFVIVVLVVLVSVLILAKMDAVLHERRVADLGRHEDQVRRTGVAVRALDLGMSNIRRRPQRGFLTGLSVVMVTFILLSFTSMVPVTSISQLTYPRGALAYRGLLTRDRAWEALPDALEASIQRNYSAHATTGAVSLVSSRAWFFSDRTGKLSQIDLSAGDARHKRPAAKATVSSLLCLEPTEPLVTGVDGSLIAGRWFTPQDVNGIILSSYVASRLGVGPDDMGAEIRVFGDRLVLTGIVDDRRFEAIRDLDGEPLTPVNFVLQQERIAEAAGSGEAPAKPDTLDEYVHYSASQMAIVPYRYGRRLGAGVRSVAVRLPDTIDVAAQAKGYATRSNLTVLGADADAVTVYAALDTSQISAAWQVVIPMFLGFIMILGTMLGSVYERRGEIFVYNSIGLSPTNVASLFMAESAVYAIVGAGLGYLLGQTSSKLLQATGMLSGLSLNYTAGSTIFVTLLAMLMVFLSSIYPARKAFRAAVADSEKDADAVHATGDTIAFYLPFVATPHHVNAMQAYLSEFLDSMQGVTVGLLAVDGLQAVVEQDEHGTIPVLRFRGWMAPFDLGVSHDVAMRIVYRAERGVHQYHLTATRFSGDRQNWHRLTPRFVTTLRKQLLMWRVLSAADHRKYEQRGLALFGGLLGAAGAKGNG